MIKPNYLLVNSTFHTFVFDDLFSPSFFFYIDTSPPSYLCFSLFSSKSVASLNRSPERRKHESDSSSFEDLGQAYVLGQHKPAYLLSPIPLAHHEENEIMLITRKLELGVLFPNCLNFL